MRIRPNLKKAAVLGIFPILLGVLFATGFAPLSYSWAALAALVVFILSLWVTERAGAAAVFAFFFGLGWFATGLSWTMNSMAVHGRLPWVVAFAGLVLLSALLSLLPAAAAWLAKKIAGKDPEFPFLFTGLFLLAEWLRGDWLLNFGWLTPAYAAMDTPYAAWATLAGVNGVNLAFLLSAALVVSFCGRFSRDRRGVSELFGLILIAAVGFLVRDITWSTPGPQLDVRLIQPDLPVVDAWTRVKPAERIRALMPLAQGQWTGDAPRLTVTPEGVVNTVIDRLDPASAQALIDLQRKADSPILFNGFRREERAFFNTEFALGAEGLLYRLDKRHLVPFGEFVPAGARWFVDMIGIPMSDLTPGAFSQPMMKAGNVSVGVLICYENLYGNLLRRNADSGLPDILIATANLGWFGNNVLGQYLDMSRMRAMETARPLVQVSNTGMSALIGSDGRVERSLAAEGCDAATFSVTGRVGGATPYVTFGDWPALISTGLLLLLSLFCRRRRLRKKIFCH